jgi:hypothetical protein
MCWSTVCTATQFFLRSSGSIGECVVNCPTGKIYTNDSECLVECPIYNNYKYYKTINNQKICMNACEAIGGTYVRPVLSTDTLEINKNYI